MRPFAVPKDVMTVPSYGICRNEFPNLYYNDSLYRVLVTLFISEEPFLSLSEGQKKIMRTLRINGCMAETL
jgi:hypothetical protein